VAQTEVATRKGAYRRVEVFEYASGPESPALPDWGGWTESEDSAPKASDALAADAVGGAVEARLRAELEKRLAEESHRSFEAGREKGRQEGRQAEREAQSAAHAAAEQERMRQATQLVGGFALERERYMHAVEQEVVKLALAVAARILRREAQMDPLLLTGAVRVALGQLSATTEVRLRVPPAEISLWSEAMALLPNLAVKPKILAGEGMRLGDCVIETELGTVDLGIRAQLGVIERGFFDRAGGSRTESPKDGGSEQAGAMAGVGREGR
jgi:flagellar assembly protein FliH